MWRMVIVRKLLPDHDHFETQRTRPPASIGFLIHRFHEFMYLMLGETVLGLIISPAGSGFHTWAQYLTLLAGFFIVVCMMFSYQIVEPQQPEAHAFRRSYAAGVSYASLYSFKTVSVLLVGISIKMTTFRPRYIRNMRKVRYTR